MHNTCAHATAQVSAHADERTPARRVMMGLCHGRILPLGDNGPSRWCLRRAHGSERSAAWLPPTGMSGRFERFDARPGGSYRMVLTHEDASTASGKTNTDSDIIEARFSTSSLTSCGVGRRLRRRRSRLFGHHDDDVDTHANRRWDTRGHPRRACPLRHLRGGSRRRASVLASKPRGPPQRPVTKRTRLPLTARSCR